MRELEVDLELLCAAMRRATTTPKPKTGALKLAPDTFEMAFSGCHMSVEASFDHFNYHDDHFNTLPFTAPPVFVAEVSLVYFWG